VSLLPIPQNFKTDAVVLRQQHMFNSLFSGISWVGWHQKDRSMLDFNEARDIWMLAASAGPFTNHLHLTIDNHASSSSLDLLA